MQNLPVIAGVEINTDTEGRFNLNALHKASGLGANKAPAQWMRTQAAKEIVQEVIDMQICTSPMKTSDCSPPCRARLPTSQAATVCTTDLRWPPWAETTSPAAFSSSIPFCRMLNAALMSRSCSTPHSGHRQMRL